MRNWRFFNLNARGGVKSSPRKYILGCDIKDAAQRKYIQKIILILPAPPPPTNTWFLNTCCALSKMLTIIL